MNKYNDSFIYLFIMKNKNDNQHKFRTILVVETTYDPSSLGNVQLVIDASLGSAKIKRKVKKIK